MTTTASSFAAMAFAAALLLASCSNSTEPTAVDPSADAPAFNDAAGSGMDEQAPEMQLQQSNDFGAVQGDVKMNPAHGEPGHDCAVPVGAPLNGSGSNGTSITIPEPSGAPVASPVTSPITSPATSPNMGSGKINPAHGEPGHDCAVPVGSPLP